MTHLSNRITVDIHQCGGRPCVRGMRIRVSDVIDLFSSGLTSNDILKEMPDLTEEDLKACLEYASKRIDHPVENTLETALELIEGGESLVEVAAPVTQAM